MRKILVVSVNWLGDTIFALPVFYNIKIHYPDAELTVLAHPRVQEVLKLSSSVDRTLVLDEKGKHRSPWEYFQLIQQLRRDRFDISFLLRPSASRAFLLAAAGVPVRVGFGDSPGSPYLTRHAEKPGSKPIHRSDIYLKVLEPAGIPVKTRTPRINLAENHIEDARRILASQGLNPQQPFIVLNTGGNWEPKQWPEQDFAQLIRKLSVEGKYHILLTGAASDLERCLRLMAYAPAMVKSVCGQTGLKELAGILKLSRAVVSADSGPLHLASATGAPTVSIFGPTRPEITGPRGEGPSVVLFRECGCNLAPCYYLECPQNRCMRKVTADDVIFALRQIGAV